MKVSLDIVGAVTGESGHELDKDRKMEVETTFYTGNKKSAVAFIRTVDTAGVPVDEVLLQVNDDGKLSLARKREV